MTQPAPVADLTPAAGRLGRLGVAVIAAILAGPPARSSGCARCGAPTPALNSRPISSIREPRAAEASGLARSATEATDGRAQDRVGRILPCLCARLRRRLLSRLLCRRPRLACEDLPGAMSERRDATLFHAVRRHDRGLRFDVRHAVRQLAQRGQIRAGRRSELLLPTQGPELGGGARRGRGEASAPPGRYPGDAGNLRADVAAGGGGADQRREGPRRRC